MNGQSNSRRGGFTLIELLVVVAIIAILAAIALPNFAEAVVRCNVARTKSDLRALATGLEAYRVDAGDYPNAELFMTYERRLRGLTSPVAYLSSLPEDVFYDPAQPGTDGADDAYCYASGNIYFGNSGLFDSFEYTGTIFSLAGRGPDKRIFAGGYCMAHPVALQNGTGAKGSYDPTNGTVSPGDILRLGGGTLGK